MGNLRGGLYGMGCPQAPAVSSYPNSHVEWEGAGGREGLYLGVEGHAGTMSWLLVCVPTPHTVLSQ